MKCDHPRLSRRISLGSAACTCLASTAVLILFALTPLYVPLLLSGQTQRSPVLPHLTDITHSSGIQFNHVAIPQKYITEEISGGVLLIDYDRDGWLDIYFTNSPTLEMALAGRKVKSALYHNNHDGTFTDVTDRAGVGFPCAWPMGGAVGDYNNDGWPDMYITCLGRNTLYKNNGDGTFTDVTDQAGVADSRWSTGAAFGDYDGDGWVDLFVANYVDYHWSDLAKLPSFLLCPLKGVMIPCGPQGLPGAGDSLYHNNRDGTFTNVSKQSGVSDPEGRYGLGVVWSDFSNSGRPDLYVANDSTPNFLYRNDGNGHFTEIGFESGTAVSGEGAAQGSMGVAIADYLRNGRFSIVVTNLMDEPDTLYRNEGNSHFTDVSFPAGLGWDTLPYVGWGTVFVDLDNDGWPDLFLVNGHISPNVDNIGFGAGYLQPPLLFLNQRNGTFRNISKEAGSAIQTPLLSRGAAFGDLDNDGNVDIVIENLDGPPMVLRNDGGNQNNWITLELAGIKSNRLALGARVEVVTGNLTQVDEVRSGGSYLSQNDLRVHFGLGKADRVDRVEIHWPSGSTETIKGLAVNRFYGIKEGAGIVPFDEIRPHKAEAPAGPSRSAPGSRLSIDSQILNRQH